MAEKLGVDGSLGYGSTVDGNVFRMFARTESMDNLRKKLLSGTTLAGDKHRQIDRRHTDGTLDSSNQRRRVADNSEALLGLKDL